MSNFIFSLGFINKSLLIPIFYMITYIGIYIYYEFFVYNEAAFFLEGISASIGIALLFFVSAKYKYQRIIHQKKKKSSKKNYIKDYFFIFLAAAFFNVSIFLQAYAGEIYKGEQDSATALYVNSALQIIFITLITYFFLKYKYYIHHYISISIFIVLSIITDLILDNYSNRNIFTFITSITIVLAYSLNYSYFKYLIAEKYYYCFDVIYIYGLCRLITFLIMLPILLAIQEKKDNHILIFQFYELYKTRGSGMIVFIFMFGLIVMGIIIGLLESIILDKLTPNYIIIGLEVGKMPSELFSIKGAKFWPILFIIIIQIISLLFYLEIFEFNFCSLNKNTKKSILKRQIQSIYDDKDEDNDNDNEEDIEIVRGYSINSITDNKEIELEEKKGENEEDD